MTTICKVSTIRHTNGKKYLFGYSSNNSRAWLYEIPDTLVNDNSSTAPLDGNTLVLLLQLENGNDPFSDNSGNAWNMVYTFSNYVNNQQYQDLRLTYDPDLARY